MQPPSRQRITSETEQTLGVLLSAVFFLFSVRLFRVEGSSMEPTLTQGEHVIVNTFRYPWFRTMRHGDVVVFECPRAHDHVLIKRVIGLGGEKVEIRKGKVYINGQPLDEPYTIAAGAYSWGPATVPLAAISHRFL